MGDFDGRVAGDVLRERGGADLLVNKNYAASTLRWLLRCPRRR
jgi:hypothetical protein